MVIILDLGDGNVTEHHIGPLVRRKPLTEDDVRLAVQAELTRKLAEPGTLFVAGVLEQYPWAAATVTAQGSAPRPTARSKWVATDGVCDDADFAEIVETWATDPQGHMLSTRAREVCGAVTVWSGLIEAKPYHGYITREALFGDMTTPEGIGAFLACADEMQTANAVLREDWNALHAWVTEGGNLVTVHDVRSGMARSSANVRRANVSTEALALAAAVA